MSVWDRRKEILYGSGLVVRLIKATPLDSARLMTLSALMVECE